MCFNQITVYADGLRASKTVGGVITSHIWDGANIAADVTNGTVTKYIRGIQLISSKQGNNEIFYNYNGHGDVVQLTSNTGSITKQYSYDAFGVEKNKDEADTNSFRYCGEYFDEETGYTYLRNRYYDSDKGRFISEDPARSGLNWYNYCDNNPIMFVDPSGLAPGDLIEESLVGLSDGQKSNINSVIQAYNHGFVNWEDMASNIVLNGGSVEKIPAVSAQESDSVININTYLYINTEAMNNPKIRQGTIDEFVEAVKNGIRSEWSGNYMGKEINVNLNILDDSDVQRIDKYDYKSNLYEFVPIFISDDLNYSHTDHNKIRLYTTTKDGMWHMTPNQMAIKAAHEFGHFAFDLPDIYNREELRRMPSLMNNRMQHRNELDFAMMSTSSVFKNTSIYNSKSPLSVARQYAGI